MQKHDINDILFYGDEIKPYLINEIICKYMNIYRGDKVVLYKELDRVKSVGKIYEVGDITGRNIIIRDIKTRVALCAVDAEVFEEYFCKPEEIRTWTKWMAMVNEYGELVGYYRTNLKRTQVKIVSDLGNVQAECCCCNDDEFNLFFGIQLSYRRALNKYLLKKENELNSKLKELYSSMRDNDNKIKVLINHQYKEMEQ